MRQKKVCIPVKEHSLQSPTYKEPSRSIRRSYGDATLHSELNKYIAELEELSHHQENDDVKPLSF